MLCFFFLFFCSQKTLKRDGGMEKRGEAGPGWGRGIGKGNGGKGGGWDQRVVVRREKKSRGLCFFFLPTLAVVVVFCSLLLSIVLVSPE